MLRAKGEPFETLRESGPLAAPASVADMLAAALYGVRPYPFFN